MVEFQHNNHVHSATQQPLFLLDTGHIPCLEMVNEFTERMRMAIEEVKSAIHKAQDDMKRYYDHRRTLATKFSSTHRISALRAPCKNSRTDSLAPL